MLLEDTTFFLFAMFPYSYTDNLPENFGKNMKNVAQEGKKSTSG